MNHALAKEDEAAQVEPINHLIVSDKPGSTSSLVASHQPTVQVRRSRLQAAGNRTEGIGNVRLASW